MSSELNGFESSSGECSVTSKFDFSKKLPESSVSNIETTTKLSVISKAAKNHSFGLTKLGTKKAKIKSKKDNVGEGKKVKGKSKEISGPSQKNAPDNTSNLFRIKTSSKKDRIKSNSKKETKKEVKNECNKKEESKLSSNIKPVVSQQRKVSSELKAACSSKLGKESKLVKEPKPLTEGTMIAFNWEIKKTLGKGSFGQVYLAEHKQTHVQIAIKTLLASYQEFRIAMERDVLKLCSEKMYFPKVYLSGMHDIYYCIGMSLLGPSLTDIRKSTKELKIEAQYCMIVCNQMVNALKTLHELGYVHRDIKPSNICTGYHGTPEAKKMTYLIDFGIVRKFIVEGVIIQPKGKGRLRGTMRYLSLNCHRLLELGPADDLHSLYYSIIELGTGHLPWKSCVDIKEVEKMKKDFDYLKHRGDLSENFYDFWITIKDVTNIQLPDYNKCIEVVEKCIPDEYKNDNFIFPWHNNSTS